MLDEYDQGASFHHVFEPIHTNKEFIHHVMYVHVGKPLSEYWPRLPHSKMKS